MFDLERIKIPPNMPLIDAIKQLNDTGNKILLVVENNVLVGVLNDGDIRRWVLSVNEGIKANFTVPVSEVMNPSPICLNGDTRERAEEFLTANYIEAAPIVNEKKEVVDIVFLNKNLKRRFRLKNLDVPVVVMAGGRVNACTPIQRCFQSR